MTNVNKHHIQQQCINLDWVGVNNAEQFQAELSGFLTGQLLPEMETLFDTLYPHEKIVTVNKIVLNLGDIDSTDWKTNLCKKLVEHLQQNLSSITKPIQKEKQHHNENPSPTVDIVFKQFLFFLKHGRLPWWGGKKSEITFQQLIKQFNKRHWQEVITLITENQQSRQRLINYCNDNALEQMLTTLYNLHNSDRVLSFFAPVASTHSLYDSWRDVCWLSLLNCIINQQSPHLAKSALQTLWYVRDVIHRIYTENSNTQNTAQTATVSSTGTITSLPQPWRNWLEGLADLPQHYVLMEPDPAHFIRRLLTGEPLQQLLRFEPPTPEHSKLSAQHDTCMLDSLSVTDSNKTTNTSVENSDKPSAGPILIEGAGAVIVHPFLKELFSEQQLLNDTEFRNEQCRHQAVQMLAYLIFGDIHYEEYDLLLAKLLCAMPWQCALVKIELTAPQREACDQLLSAILKHWQALNSESVDWLRQQFFWRSGKLKPVNEDWKLTVDGGAQDVLLNKLPWGIGVINLPWMTSTLHVAWNN